MPAHGGHRGLGAYPEAHCAHHVPQPQREAANAAAKVQEVLDAHNLSMSQVTAHEASTAGVRYRLAITSRNNPYGPTRSPMNQAWQWVMHVLDVQHQCRTFTGPGRNPPTGKTESVFVVGDPTDVQATVTLFEWLRTQLEIEATKQWRGYAERQRRRDRYQSSPMSFRINFVHGAATEIARIMRRRQESGREAAVTALVTNYKAAIDEYVESNFTMQEGKTTNATLNADLVA